MASKTTVKVEMPQMGESVTEGTILEWAVSEGDAVEEGQTLVEISTDKVDAEVPSPAAGTLVSIHAAVDEEVQVGAVLAEIDPNGAAPPDESSGGDEAAQAKEQGEEAASEEEAAPEDEAASEKEAAPEGERAEPEGQDGEKVAVEMPQMGESVTEGTILEWAVSEGDAVEEGQTLVEVSTDKVDAEVPSPATGRLVAIHAAVDEVVQVGATLAEITADGGAARAAERAGGDGAEAAEAPAAAPEPAETGEMNVSPVARRAASARGIDLSGVRGSGPRGRITKADVLAAGDGAGPAAAEGKEVRLKGPAKMLADAMNESRQVPTATSFREIAVDTLDAKRKALNEALKQRGMKVSFTHLVAWAIVQAGGEWPVMARSYTEQDGKPHAVEPGSVNLGIAVDLQRKDGSRALMVPCIKGAGAMDFPAFHSAYEELITKTREGTLGPDDFQGTNISLTNPGGIGTVASVPRLMAGQGTIVATGAIGYPPEWAHANPERIRQLGVSKVMTMTSTYDHRVIQGAESGSFLKRIEELLQGEDGFYESVARSLDVAESTVSNAHPASKSAPPLGAPQADGPVAGVTEAKPDLELMQGVQAATSLLKAYRTHGHLAAHLDPLGSEPKGDPALEPENLNLTPELMRRIPASILRLGVSGETLLDVLPRMRDAYCGTIGYQIEHLSSHQQRMWLREMVETGAHRRPVEAEEQRSLLGRLIEVHEFERFLQRTYLGQKSFSIEGLDATVPMLDELSTIASRAGAEEVVLGMAHRGRLSVLAHNLGRPHESIFAEFEGAKQFEALESVLSLPHGGTGDVKYHHGAEGLFETRDGDQMNVRLCPNPSHLEYVDPVVTGGARAAQTEHAGPKLHHNPATAVPVLLHGDAAFPGQGVVAETLNLQALDGYSTGGTIHLIQNNQIGFTTDPNEARSTPYAGDLAKGFNVPIIHVNADDVEACIAAVRLAMAYREKWQRDVVIDLIGYRRLGHNESDEPAYTQPTMYAAIKDHPPVYELYASHLEQESVISAEEVSEEQETQREELKRVHKQLKEKIESGEYEDPSATGTGTTELDRTQSPEVKTAVEPDRLRHLNEELIRVPESFTIHRKLRKPLHKRLEAIDEGGIDFGQAEALAFASLLTEGYHVRLTGQDTARGTFSHRHLVLHEEKTGLPYAPIQNLSGALAPFELYNSPLSEVACLGFEYGYSARSPESLILWEAQFGDFNNAAQVTIDQFIVSAEAKWGQTTRLTLLLPHGYEGQGPEHSSARIERFLTLAAEGNIRVANPTTAAQYFHLLRRQARIAKPRPLVVFTPKGLLRLSEATSSLEDLSEGQLNFVLDDPRAAERRDEVTRLVLCSGKVYYDMDGHRKREEASHVAIARVELLYPFARTQIREAIDSYPNVEEVVWLQEEPQNMGAWPFMRNRIGELVPEGVDLRYVGRPMRASPSEGYPAAHRIEQERIVVTGLSSSR